MSEIKVKRLKRGWLGKKTSLYVTSPFGVVRKLSSYKKARIHHGMDIGVPVGTPIYAPVDGSVSVRKIQGGGLTAFLTAKGFQYIFMHLSRSAASGGVKEGQVIGYTGGAKGNPNSGTSTGPHLHFEVRKSPYKTGVDAINPIYFVSDALTGKVKQNRMSSEIVSVLMVGEKPADGEEEVEYYTTLTEEQLKNDQNVDVSDYVDSSSTEDETIVLDTEYKEGLASGIWQITKLVMDTEVANIRIRDAATSIQQGSLITFFNKVCQKPFVEFSGDTFGDQYYFMVRKPPFDKEGMIKTMTAQGLYKNEGGKDLTPETLNVNNLQVNSEYGSPYIINEDDIISANLSFNTQGIYSWYQFYPIYEMGAQSDLQYIIPAVLFPEYAAIWGSRDLQIRSQYRNFINPNLYDNVNEGKENAEGDTEVRHSMKDLKYIIESNAYAPFIRQGTIQLVGNRKIKRGTYIRVVWNSMIEPEIFYVESVSNNYSVSLGSVNRVTTVSVSHGMIEPYILGISANSLNSENSKNLNVPTSLENISYFNLINFGDYEKQKDKLNMDKWSEVISSWKVNSDVFQFFLRKLQLLTNINTAGSQIKSNVSNFKKTTKTKKQK